jgi:hypothetical protein
MPTYLDTSDLFWQAVMEAHDTRSRTLSGLRSKFHTARPWQKKLEANTSESSQISGRNFAESSEEEMDQVKRAFHPLLL